MGESTNAILFWGYTWDEETREPWNIGKDEVDEGDEDESNSDWETRYIITQGLKSTDAYSKRSKVIDASPCIVDTHCHGECPMPYVAIRGSRVLAYRGYPEQIDPAHFMVQPEWREQLDSFCHVMGIPIPKDGPRWYLVSDWN